MPEVNGETFVQSEYGYCFYEVDESALIYNLYVYPEFRRNGHATDLLHMAVKELRATGYCGQICVEVVPTEDSVCVPVLANFYVKNGLELLCQK